MYKKRNTKRALMASLLSLVMCTSMLIGSTFAWFTDNASTAVNSIESGTLKIGLYTDEDCTQTAEGQTLSFAKAGENVLWEPGATWTLPTLYLKNEGNLAAKYKVEITGINGDAELNKVIDWTIETGIAAGETEGHLDANGGKKEIKISGTMQTTAGNEYQGLTIDGIGITVLATQDTVEYDSNNNTYDANAEYDPYAGYDMVTVANQTELNDAIPATSDPTVIKLASGTYKLPEPDMQNKNIVFKADGNAKFDFTEFNVNATQRLIGATITFDGVNVDFPANSWHLNGYTGLNLAGGKLTIKNSTVSGAQYLYVPTAEFINCVFENSADSYSVCTYAAADVTFTGCTFNAAGKAVLMYNDGPVTTSVTAADCVFNSNGTQADDKAAIETGDDGSKGSNFTINFTDCTANGFVANNSTSALWGNKVNSNMPDTRLNVIIDGVDVY